MDQHEFEQFVLENGKNILRFCRLTCQDTESGDELYQDTMLKLLDKRQQLDSQQNVQSYALSISILLWKNKKKKYANRNRLIPMESMDAMEHDKISELKEESADLPEKFRIPIHLYYSADLSIQEIAETLKIPEGTVKSRLNKARQLLKKELEEIGYDR